MEPVYRGLGFDPTPGDPDAVVRTVAQLVAAAEALAGTEPALRRAEEISRDWHGETADAFRSRLRNLPSGLDTRERSMRRAAAVLERWAETLTANRHRAEELDRRAVALRGRIQAATDDLQDRQNAADLAATPAAAASANVELAAGQARLADLESELAEVLAAARRLERDHLRAADAFADELAGTRDEDQQAAARAQPPFARAVGEALGRASRISGTLAGLLLPPGGTAAPAPGRAAGALAEAITARGGNGSR